LKDKDGDKAQDRDRDRDRIHQDDAIYGSSLMTEEERNQYQKRLGEAKSEEEKARIRAEHQEQMRERARQEGVELPEPPPET
jgi:chorismate mutase